MQLTEQIRNIIAPCVLIGQGLQGEEEDVGGRTLCTPADRAKEDALP